MDRNENTESLKPQIQGEFTSAHEDSSKTKFAHKRDYVGMIKT